VEVRLANGTVDTVRLVGVDTPEVHTENDPTEFEGVPDSLDGHDCLRRWGERASAFAKERLSGAEVTLAFDPDTDRRGYYGRLLAYVRVDGGTFNYRLVADGYARVYDSEFSRADRYYRAESAAQENRTGLWTCRNPERTVTPTPTGAGVVVVGIRADAPGDDNDNLNAEYVVLRNRGDAARNLTGWTVEDDADHVYEFDRFVLDPGATVTVHTGSGTDNATHVYWGRTSAVWNNDGDTVVVRAANGTVVTGKPY
jgi:micrococcal nuclease